MKFTIGVLIMALSIAAQAKRKDLYPSISAQFETINNWKGNIKISYIKFECFMNECTWAETEIDQCIHNTTQLYINWHPPIYTYSTSTDSLQLRKMNVKPTHEHSLSVSLDAGYNVTADYVLKFQCPEKSQPLSSKCKIESVTGSMIDENSERTTYDIFSPDKVKDLKLSRCDEDKK